MCRLAGRKNCKLKLAKPKERTEYRLVSLCFLTEGIEKRRLYKSELCTLHSVLFYNSGFTERCTVSLLLFPEKIHISPCETGNELV